MYSSTSKVRERTMRLTWTTGSIRSASQFMQVPVCNLHLNVFRDREKSPCGKEPHSFLEKPSFYNTLSYSVPESASLHVLLIHSFTHSLTLFLMKFLASNPSLKCSLSFMSYIIWHQDISLSLPAGEKIFYFVILLKFLI